MGARLVTSDDGVVELAHEAVARAWPRLRAWLDDDVEGQRILRHLTVAADTWEAMGRPESELYRGVRLTNALDWRERARPRLSRDRAGVPRHQRQAGRGGATDGRASGSVPAPREPPAPGTADRNGRDPRRCAARGHRRGAAGRDTARQRDSATLEALANRSLALRPIDRAAAALLAVEAYRRAPDDPRAHSALFGTFTAAPGFLGYQNLPADEFLFGATVPGTSTAVVALDGRDLRLLDLASGKLDDRFPPTDVKLSDDLSRSSASVRAAPARQPSLLRVSADGRFVVHMTTTDSSDSCFDAATPPVTDDRPCVAFSVYELARGRRVLGPIAPSFGAGDVAINADGSLVAVAGGYDGELAVYRTADGELLGNVAGLPRPVDLPSDPWINRSTAAVVFGPDAIYLGSLQGPIRVVDPATVQVLRTFDAPLMSAHLNLVLTSDGLLVGNGRVNMVAIDTSTGATRWSEDIYDASLWARACGSLAIAPAIERVYCGNTLGEIIERDLATGRPTGVPFKTQLGWIGDVATTSDGRELVAFGGGPVISRWRLDGSGPVVDEVAAGRIALGGYDPTGEMLLVSPRDTTDGLDPSAPSTGADLAPAVWDPVSDEAIDELDGSSGALWFGSDLLSGYFAGALTLYDVTARAPVQSDPRPPNPRNFVWMSPDGDRAYTSVVQDDSETGPRCEIWTYDPDRRRRIEPTIQLVGEFDDECSFDAHVSGTRDGRRVVVTTGTSTYSLRTTTVYDGRTGEQLAGPLHGPIVTSVSPDGVLVGGDGSGAITQYDLDTLEPIGAFPGTQNLVTHLSFSADGEILVAASLNQTLSIYDVATRTRLGDPVAEDFTFFAGAAVRPDGKAVATNSPRGVAVWDIDPEHLADAACRVAGRNLTPTEWDTYLGNAGEYRATCPGYD